MPHPLVDQLRFTRSEFLSGVIGHTRLPQFVGNIDDQASYRHG